MQNETKSSYPSQVEGVISKNLKEESGSIGKRAARVSNNLINTVLWLVLIAGWFPVYLLNDQPLFGEILPAYLIVTCLMFLRAMDRQNSMPQ